MTGEVKYWWQKPRLEDGDDMLKDALEQEGKEIGITLNAAGTGILLQLGETPECHRCELHQIRVTLNRGEAMALKWKLERLIGCLPENLTAVLTTGKTENAGSVVPEAGIEPATKGL